MRTNLKRKSSPPDGASTPSQGQVLVKAEWTPLYHQLYLILRAKILNGDYREGDLLPGEFDLVDLYGVSRITARRALSEIARAGLAIRERGRGTRVLYVSDATIMRGPAEAEDIDEQSKFITWEIISFGNVPAPAAVAAALSLDVGASIQEMARILSYRRRAPYGLVTTYVILEIAGNWTRDDMLGQSLYGKIERSGTVVDQIDECVSACPADRLLSNHLDVPIGTPLIKITRTMFTGDNSPIEHVISHYVPERYQYRTSLKRTGNRMSLKRKE